MRKFLENALRGTFVRKRDAGSCAAGVITFPLVSVMICYCTKMKLKSAFLYPNYTRLKGFRIEELVPNSVERN